MMLTPPAAFSRADLDIAIIPVGSAFRRIYWAHHHDPLGFAKSESRFSDPRRRVEANRFGVLYLGSSLKVCFLEAVLRDRRDALVDELPLDEAELMARSVAAITPKRDLRLLDLRGDGPVRMGIPSEVVRGKRQSLARKWSLAFHEHGAGIDGIIYPSRLNGEHNVAVYDRAITALASMGTAPLMKARGFVDILDDFKLAIR
ncbi:RES family NAD+ phosphorylase [Sphingobium sp. TB-6]|uniref:RES family NAD+ phosphorylase n=1 Tax=Sphingobium sp. TB-6 TaxID=2728850 RepID=UPI0019D030A1|nr:RES family NAD+ phosphorylase [Sphingobium sp. TB-6]